MRLVAKRGDDNNIFVVEDGGKYYLINLDLEYCSQPAIAPAIFLRFGYFDKVARVDNEVFADIKRVFMIGTRPSQEEISYENWS